MSLNKSTLKITSILGAKKEKPASDSKVNRLNTIHYGIEKVAERILGSKMNFNYRTTYHYPNVLTIDFNLTEKISVYIYVDDASSLIKITLDESIQPAVHGYNPEDHSIKKHPKFVN